MWPSWLLYVAVMVVAVMVTVCGRHGLCPSLSNFIIAGLILHSCQFSLIVRVPKAVADLEGRNGHMPPKSFLPDVLVTIVATHKSVHSQRQCKRVFSD